MVPLVLFCWMLGVGSARALTKYWDIDGPTPGAGGTNNNPHGVWDQLTANWTTSPDGDAVATTWASGDDAVFSASANATNAFQVDVSVNQTAGNLTVEEANILFNGGILNIGGGGAGKGIMDIAPGRRIAMVTFLAGGDDTGTVRKTGGGKLQLVSDNSLTYSGTTIVAQGELETFHRNSMGSATAPTIVSNGAALVAYGDAAQSTISEPVLLHGEGLNSTGGVLHAFGNVVIWSGRITPGSASRINSDCAGNLQIQQFAPTNADCTFGGAGNHRLNVNGAFALGTGKLIKDGAGYLQTEMTTYVCSEMWINDGILLFRQLGSIVDNTLTNVVPITFGVEADAMATLAINSFIRLGNPITLNASNLTVSVAPNNPLTLIGVIGGPGGLTKTNTGRLELNNVNTYGGNTIIAAGTLVLATNVLATNVMHPLYGVSASISNSPVIEVRGAGTLDVVSNATAFVLGPAQTLEGGGIVRGDVIANGTLAPGDSVGALSFSNNLTLGGNLLIELDKSLSPSNDVINVAGTVTNTGSGSVMVTNLSPGQPLAAGDSFQLFSQPVLNGQALTVVSGGGVTWSNRLADDGSIVVLSAPSPAAPATNLIIAVAGPNSIFLGGRGAGNTTYDIHASTNVTLPMTNWWLVGTTNSDAGGMIQFFDSTATNGQRFYRFGQNVP